MAGKQKIFRPKARKPRGFGDQSGSEVLRARAILGQIAAIYHAYGFDPLETPAFEYTDALGKFLPDIDRPNQGVFSLADEDGQWMSLRYDLTAPLARFAAEHFDALPKPFRRYQMGPVWRNEKPGPGRFREFTQCDADSIGAPAPYADAEICAMLAEVVTALGIKEDEFRIGISDRQVMSGLLESIGLVDPADPAQTAPAQLAVLRAMDKFDRLGELGVRQLLGEGRKDASGDYTQGAQLSPGQIDHVMAFMMSTKQTNAETCDALRALVGSSGAGAAGIATLEGMAEMLDRLGLSPAQARIDLSIIRGLDYYTGPVFEVDLTFAIEDAKGRPVRFGAIASGGRYDDLVKRFKGIEVPAVGCSVGVSRLLAALKLRQGAQEIPCGPIVILALEASEMGSYQQIAAELRRAGHRAEVYLGGSSMRAQMKYADRRKAPLCLIIGEDERKRGAVTIKDLVLGKEISKDILDNRTWREDQPAQVSVPRGKLLEAVAETLRRHQL